MFDIAPTELLLVAVIALLVIGPKELPRMMRTVGQWIARARGVARHFRSGLDAMVREAELEEMEKKWRAENEAIMRDYPSPSGLEIPPPPVLESHTSEGIEGSAEAAPELPLEQPAAPAKPQPELP